MTALVRGDAGDVGRHMMQARTGDDLTVCVVVDVEEEFDWAKPFSSDNWTVSSLGALTKLQATCDRYGVKPAYLMTHPVVKSPQAAEVIGPFLAQGKCTIGAQLHSWVTPPLTETINSRNSYACNLSPDLENQKIESLVASIQDVFGEAPLVFRSGRYGLNLDRWETLVKNGFKVDVSTVPYANYRDQDDGPDFFGLPESPFWINATHQLLEIPMTQGLSGVLRHGLPAGALRMVYGRWARRWRLPSVLARTGLLERLRLSPEGHSLQDMKRLVRSRLSSGEKIFCLSFHSPSLVSGHTPYARTEEEARALHDSIDGILKYLIEDVGAKPTTPMDIHADYARRLAR